MNKITFVCTANKYRSPVLQYTLQLLLPEVEVSSQGIAQHLPKTRQIASTPSKCKHLNTWASYITCDTVRRQLLLHKPEQYSNNSDTMYIFVSDRHKRKYSTESNCYSISDFIDKKAIDDPLVKSRSSQPMEYIYADIVNVCNNVKKYVDMRVQKQ